MSILVITNGDVATDLLKAAGLAGDSLIAWRDVLHEGPVVDDGDLAGLSARRAAYLAETYSAGNGVDSIAEDFRARDAAFVAHPNHERVELWFEHDLYDQLQLLQILTLFDRDGRHDGVFLVQAPSHLGLETPETIGRFAADAVELAPEAFALAARAWAAFASGTPEKVMAAVETEDMTALPWLRPALLRLLAELPDDRCHLSQTDWMILDTLNEQGPLPAGPLFKAYQARETAAFHGDLSFFDRLDGLKEGGRPLVEGPAGAYRTITRDADGRPAGAYLETPFALTDAGKAVLSGEAGMARPIAPGTWFGATELGDAAPWRWDRTRQTLIGA